MKTLICVGADCGGRPVTGSLVCAQCRRALGAALDELPRLYEDCGSALLPRRDPAMQRVSGSRGAVGIHIDEDAIATRSEILGFLASWAALVADERATRPPRRHPAQLSAYLARHLGWLLAHPAAADFADEARRVTARGHRVAYIPPVSRLELGECIHSECDAAMATIPAGRDGGYAQEVRCAAGHSWPPHQWLHLLRQIQVARLSQGAA